MIDAQLRRLIDPVLDRCGAWLAGRAVPADAVTWAGFALGCAAFPLLATQHYMSALACLLLNRLCDGLDGAVARARGRTPLGGFLDIVLDMIVYSGIVFFFALGQPHYALEAAFLIFSFIGTGSSFLAFAAIAARHGVTTERRGKRKAIYYLGGIAEGFETIVALSLICLLPQHFPLIAIGFGVMCWVTTAMRITEGIVAFRRL